MIGEVYVVQLHGGQEQWKLFSYKFQEKSEAYNGSSLFQKAVTSCQARVYKYDNQGFIMLELKV